jgi:MFS superfamily sulfate permease-like transporter
LVHGYVCGYAFLLTVEGRPSTIGGAILVQVILSSIRKLIEQAREIKPVNSISFALVVLVAFSYK